MAQLFKVISEALASLYVKDPWREYIRKQSWQTRRLRPVKYAANATTEQPRWLLDRRSYDLFSKRRQILAKGCCFETFIFNQNQTCDQKMLFVSVFLISHLMKNNYKGLILLNVLNLSAQSQNPSGTLLLLFSCKMPLLSRQSVLPSWVLAEIVTHIPTRASSCVGQSL